MIEQWELWSTEITENLDLIGLPNWNKLWKFQSWLISDGKKQVALEKKITNSMHKEKETATKIVRKVQKRQNTEKRTNLIEEINAAAENEPTLFHKLVKK